MNVAFRLSPTQLTLLLVAAVAIVLLARLGWTALDALHYRLSSFIKWTGSHQWLPSSDTTDILDLPGRRPKPTAGQVRRIAIYFFARLLGERIRLETLDEAYLRRRAEEAAERKAEQEHALHDWMTRRPEPSTAGGDA